MLKAYGWLNNRHTLMLGLSRENTKRLHEGKPVVVDVQAFLQQLGEKVAVQDVVIFAGETEDAMRKELSQYARWDSVE